MAGKQQDQKHTLQGQPANGLRDGFDSPLLLLDWRTIPRGIDRTSIRCLFEAVFHCTRLTGLSLSQAKDFKVILRWTLLRACENDIRCFRRNSSGRGLSRSESILIDLVLRQTSRSAFKRGLDKLSGLTSGDLRRFSESMEALEV